MASFTSEAAPSVEVYSTLGCKYCRIAKAKLTELGIAYVNVDIQDVNIADVLSQNGVVNTVRVTQRVLHAQKSTVPQIYVDDEHIGGCTELLAEATLPMEGISVLYERLQRKGIKWGQLSSHQSNQGANNTTKAANVGHKDAADYTPTKGEPLNSLRFASDSMRAPGTHMAAVEVAEQLQQRALALTDKFATADGKRVQYAAMLTSPEFAEYVTLSCRLQQCNLQELAALSHTEKIAFYANLYNALIIHANCVLRIEETAPGLEPVSKVSLTSPEAIAQRSLFFSGASGAVYRIGGSVPNTVASDADQCDSAAAVPTDSVVSVSIDVTPDMIEHAILRANMPHPSQVNAALAQDTTRDATYYYQHLSYVPTDHPTVMSKLPIDRDRFDPRIHFILNCGAVSCPPIKVLDSSHGRPQSVVQSQAHSPSESQPQPVSAAAATADGDSAAEAGGNVESALCAAAAAYLHSEVSVDVVQKHIYLPRLLLWYERDFGSDLTAVLGRTAQLMSDSSEMKGVLQTLLLRAVDAGMKIVDFVAEGSAEEQQLAHDDQREVFVVKYNAYDWTLNSV